MMVKIGRALGLGCSNCKLPAKWNDETHTADCPPRCTMKQRQRATLAAFERRDFATAQAWMNLLAFMLAWASFRSVAFPPKLCELCGSRCNCDERWDELYRDQMRIGL